MAIILLLLAPILSTGQVVAATSPSWWTPTGQVQFPQDLEDAWNLRVRLIVSNPGGTILAARTPVQAQIDLAETMAAAGWPHRAEAEAAALKSFTLGFESLRLVRYTNDWAGIVGEVPVTAFRGWLTPAEDQSSIFDPRSNPEVTLEWFTPATISGNGRDYYYAYFEIEQNSKKLAPQLEPSQQQRLEAMYWVGAGTHLYGDHPGEDGASLGVVGVRDNTVVTVLYYPEGSSVPVPHQPSAPFTNPFTVSSGGGAIYNLGLTPLQFRIDATQPLIVYQYAVGDVRGIPVANSPDFVPSLDGNLVGRHFLVPRVTAQAFITALPEPITPPSGARIVFQGVGGPAPGPITLEGGTSYTLQMNSATLYDITSTTDVVVQLVPTAGSAQYPAVIAQAPSIHGGPVGTDFLASTLAVVNGRLRVTAIDDAVHLNVKDTNTDPPRQLIDANVEPGHLTRLDRVPTGFPTTNGAVTNPVHLSSVPPSGGSTGGRFMVQIGEVPNPTVGQSTPFGGRHGMDFYPDGPFVVFAHYPATKITIELLDQGRIDQGVLDEANPFFVETAPNERSHLIASKPVAVLPLGDPGRYSRFLPAKPHFLIAEVGAGEYRGYVLDIHPENQNEPLFYQGTPGGTVRIPFAVSNNGRNSDGDVLPDQATISFVTKPAVQGLEASFETSTHLGLPTSGLVATALNLRVPTLPPNQAIAVTIEARSVGNAHMEANFTAFVSAEQSYGVKMWWGSVGADTGKHGLIAQLNPGETQPFPFVLENTGSQTDSFLLDLAEMPGGWAARVLRAGQRITSVVGLPAGSQAALELEVQAPTAEQFGDIILTIDAASTGSGGTVSRRIVLNTQLSLGKGLQVTADPDQATIMPGASHTFVVVAANTGGDPLTLRLSMASRLPAGWTAAFAGLGDPKNGTITITRGQSIEVPIRVQVPANAPAHALGSILISARGTADAPEVQAGVSLIAEVATVNGVAIEGPAGFALAPTATHNFTVDVRNLGNAPARMHLLPISLPGGWNLTLPKPFDVASASTPKHVDVRLKVPPTALAGTYTLRYAAVSDQGASAAAQTIVEVTAQHALAWSATDPALARHGEEIRRTLRLSNLGNTVEDVRISALAPEGWSLELQPKLATLPPGEHVTLEARWTVPGVAPVASHVFKLTAAGIGSSAVAETEFVVRVADADLRIAEIVVPPARDQAGQVLFISVLVTNAGPVPQDAVALRLLNGDQVLDEVTFDSIGPNSTVIGALRWVREGNESANVEIGSYQDGVYAGSVRNDLPAVALAAPPSQSPGIDIALGALVVGAAAFVVRYRRRSD